jgi:hypothetical protein
LPSPQTATAANSCDVECRGDGSVLVRVHSIGRDGRPLPDAVFTFRTGDPQYAYWRNRANGTSRAEIG